VSDEITTRWGVAGRVATLQADIGHLDSLAMLQEDLDRGHADVRQLINAPAVFLPKPFSRFWTTRIPTTA